MIQTRTNGDIIFTADIDDKDYTHIASSIIINSFTGKMTFVTEGSS